MSPADSFRQLTPERQRLVHLRLCDEALGVWRAYAAKHSPIRYTDSVVGMLHMVDVDLPHDALRSAIAGADLADVASRYREPIVAMQDDDLQLPNPAEFAYYAVYNCFRRYALAEEIDPWLMVNQALSSIDDESSWSPRLMAAVAAANGSGMISCKFCLFRFDGDIVCMNCATGYRIKIPPGHRPDVGQTYPIVKKFHMTTERINGKIHCKFFTAEEATDLTITLVSGEPVNVAGMMHVPLRYPTEDLTCPRCQTRQLKFYLARPDLCPQCHKQGLERHAVFNSILLPPQQGG